MYLCVITKALCPSDPSGARVGGGAPNWGVGSECGRVGRRRRIRRKERRRTGGGQGLCMKSQGRGGRGGTKLGGGVREWLSGKAKKDKEEERTGGGQGFCTKETRPGRARSTKLGWGQEGEG
ncbi:hypothetical protein M8J76_007673 [Diaphorina citri]|nr:hypothetical protein M8J75_000478 [Diaphorina citri]KAI5749483.1 hypothetical protein M8J76_007673 [Diaphorina citri]KAI5756116.1 hypothetical protein M8J77_022234 [Diaphorina citri]